MIDSNGNLEKGKIKMGALVFCVALFVLFMLVAFISWPKEKDINIISKGIENIAQDSNSWCILEEGSYKILDKFGEYVTRDSTFYYVKRYYYFNVLVTDSNGKTAVMAVRTGKKTKSLEKGKAVRLYGIVSALEAEEASLQVQSLNKTGVDEKLVNGCLYDNDDSLIGRYAQSILGLFLGILDLLLMIFLSKR